MSKRLQVVMEEREWRNYERIAKAQHVTLSEWARQALRQARSAVSLGDLDAKLRAVRIAAVSTAAPSPDIEQMLSEIESGYLAPGTE